MSAALEDCRRADFIGSSVFRHDQADVVIPLKDLVDTVMQETDTDGAFAGAYHLGRAGAGLGVLDHVLVKSFEIFHSLIVALHLNHGVYDKLCRTGCIRIGKHDQARILFLRQIIPGCGSFQAETVKLFRIHHKSEDSFIDAVPAVCRILILLIDQVHSVGCFIGFQKIRGNCLIIGVCGSAEPDVAGRIACFFRDLCINFGSGKSLIDSLDIVCLLKLRARRGEIFLLAGTVDSQFALFLGCRDQIGQIRAFRLVCEYRDRGTQTQRHQSGKHCC